MDSGVQKINREGVSGFLHQPLSPTGDGVVLAHGAGSDSKSRLLVVVAEALCDSGFVVLRYDLPFRQIRPHGPPMPGHGARDRAGLRAAADFVRESGGGRIVMGGHSYGGRQSSMLAAEQADVCDALLLLSYPLHPPRKPEQLRTEHLPAVRIPALFVHGTRDPFGSPEEIEAAVRLLSGPTFLSQVPGAGHDLNSGKFDVPGLLIEPLLRLLVKEADVTG
jgi:predicted alpha/beta-hydrolase family hydrolase